MNSLTRTAGYLIRRGTDTTSAERDNYETRKKAVLATLSRAVTGAMVPELTNLRERLWG